ncbi:type II toxin-antitoxin system Phd/YefM family antitoxin [Nocardia arthritidis]|nr:type II toxin-antitoxin system Phd/YefM family antitoxin [Nocardia arthritidis]
MEDQLSVREARAQLPAIINAAVQDGHVTVITRAGAPVGAFIPMYMLAKLEEWEDEQLASMADEALAEGGEPERITLGQMMDEILEAGGHQGAA